MSQIQRGLRFQQLHTAEAIFLMPNAWDVGSALMLASCGFPAIATTSAGVAFSLGFPDQEAAVSRETMLDRVGSIAAASPLPVSADLQSGYGASPEEVGETIAAAIRAGVVGANIEEQRQFQAFALEAVGEQLAAAFPGRHQHEDGHPGDQREPPAIGNLQDVGGQEDQFDGEEAGE